MDIGFSLQENIHNKNIVSQYHFSVVEGSLLSQLAGSQYMHDNTNICQFEL